MTSTVGGAGSVEAAQNNPPVVARNYRPIGKNSLVGIVDLEIPKWHLVFRGCLWFRKGEREWLHFPTREWIDSRNGERRFANVVEFTDQPTYERFQSAGLTAARHLAAQGTSS
jgi:hypothetical protein